MASLEDSPAESNHATSQGQGLVKNRRAGRQVAIHATLATDLLKLRQLAEESGSVRVRQ